MDKLTKEEDAKLNSDECPKCGSNKFYHLAWGGLAQNITCENGHKFWYAPPFTSEYIGSEPLQVK